MHVHLFLVHVRDKSQTAEILLQVTCLMILDPWRLPQRIRPNPRRNLFRCNIKCNRVQVTRHEGPSYSQLYSRPGIDILHYLSISFLFLN